jgi:hypothetical protein
MNRARQHDLLEVPTLADHFLHGILVAHGDDVLRDDRTGVEIRNNVVARRADDLHAAGERRKRAAAVPLSACRSA